LYRLNARDCIVEHESGFFNDVLNDEDARKRWAPFICISLEDQDSMLCAIGGNSLPRETALGEEALLLRGHSVQPKYAEALKRCSRNAGYFDFLCRLEVLLTHYLLIVGSCGRTVEEQERMVEVRFVEEGGNQSPFVEKLLSDGVNRFPLLQVSLLSSYHRLLCHALCSYYRLESASVGPDENRVTQIRIGKAIDRLAPDWVPSMPQHSLAALLVN
jgi:hypothetical protein